MVDETSFVYQSNCCRQKFHRRCIADWAMYKQSTKEVSDAQDQRNNIECMICKQRLPYVELWELSRYNEIKPEIDSTKSKLDDVEKEKPKEHPPAHQMIEFVVKDAGLNINAPDRDGFTILHHAAENMSGTNYTKDKDRIQSMFHMLLRLESTTRVGHTILFRSFELKDYRLAMELIRAGCRLDEDERNWKDGQGYTLLDHALRSELEDRAAFPRFSIHELDELKLLFDVPNKINIDMDSLRCDSSGGHNPCRVCIHQLKYNEKAEEVYPIIPMFLLKAGVGLGRGINDPWFPDRIEDEIDFDPEATSISSVRYESVSFFTSLLPICSINFPLNCFNLRLVQ